MQIQDNNFRSVNSTFINQNFIKSWVLDLSSFYCVCLCCVSCDLINFNYSKLLTTKTGFLKNFGQLNYSVIFLDDLHEHNRFIALIIPKIQIYHFTSKSSQSLHCKLFLFYHKLAQIVNSLARVSPIFRNENEAE